MSKSLNGVSILTLVLVLAGCYSIHKPTYIPSQNDKVMPVGTPQAQVTVQRNYFLFFGGANKRPMMAEARQEMAKRYVGFLPFEFINIAVDEKKSTYFLVYSNHRLTLSANLVMLDIAHAASSKTAVEEVTTYGFVEGDQVYFSNTTSAAGDIIKSMITLRGTIKTIAGKLAVIELNGEDINNPKLKWFDGFVNVKELQLLPKYLASYHENDTVSFLPRGYSGMPFKGQVVDFVTNYSVRMRLIEADALRWKSLGGEVDTSGIIIVPTFRVYH
jgi:hypothetical protein